MRQRYWLVLPNGSRQLIDPVRFDLPSVSERARQLGGRLMVEVADGASTAPRLVSAPPAPRGYEPPVGALAPLFRSRLERVHCCRHDYFLDINVRPTHRMLGGYYRRRRLVRVYTHDRLTGRRPLEELFDTFLHEIAHHLEYTEPDSFDAAYCGRRRGVMHSALFYRILECLKRRWMELQQAPPMPEPHNGAARSEHQLWFGPWDDERD